ncbi:hypothetical protein Tco_0529324 [Tanacetum coccineum]
MAQHILPVAQLVPQVKPIGRCNNYAVLQSIPCSPECKIVGQILLNHPISYALTVTADVPAVYLQQFWRTVSKVPDTKDTIKFLLDTQQFTHTVDMFRDTLNLPMETPQNPCVVPANIQTIESFVNKVGYQGVVDKLFHAVVNRTNVDYAAFLWWDFMTNVFQKKETIQYPRFIKLIIADMMKKFPNIPKRFEEEYHSIKDDVPFISVYNREFVSTQRTNRSTPRALRSPTISASPQERKKRKQTARESSSPRNIIKKKKQPTPSILPPGDDRERDEMA